MLQKKIIVVHYVGDPAFYVRESQDTVAQVPGDKLDRRELAVLILKDQLQVRFQLQLHKFLWGADTKGV